MNIVMLVLNDMSADARIDREASALAEAGYDVTVLALRADGMPERERRDHYTVWRVADYTTATWRNPIGKLRQSQARRRAFFEAGLELRPDVVHAHDTDTLSVGVLLADVMHIPLIYDAHELYPDMISVDESRRSLPVQAYWRVLERRLVPRADVVFTVGEAVAEVLGERYDCTPLVIRNVPPLQALVASDRLRAECGIDAHTVVLLWQGMISPGRGLKSLIEAMRDVHGAALVIQGGGVEEARLRVMPQELGVTDRVFFTGMAPIASLHEYACSADIGVAMHRGDNLSFRLAEPNKLFSYLMAGIPVAAADLPGIRTLIGFEDVAMFFDPDDPASIAGVLQSLVDDAAMRSRMGANARRLAETRYNWDVEQRVLIDAYDRLDLARR